MMGFFNGTGHPRLTLLITAVTTVANALLNQLFIFRLGWGIAGSAWATNAAQILGLALALAIFLRADYRRRYSRTSPGACTPAGCSSSCGSACRWGCRRRPTCSATRSSR